MATTSTRGGDTALLCADNECTHEAAALHIGSRLMSTFVVSLSQSGAASLSVVVPALQSSGVASYLLSTALKATRGIANGL
ncbi:MAG: hypothetical protein EOL87_11320 [Spartobacteria bacterium]|nr:hypothetical protein [Spartobacteria bacterium]